MGCATLLRRRPAPDRQAAYSQPDFDGVRFLSFAWVPSDHLITIQPATGSPTQGSGPHLAEMLGRPAL